MWYPRSPADCASVHEGLRSCRFWLFLDQLECGHCRSSVHLNDHCSRRGDEVEGAGTTGVATAGAVGGATSGLAEAAGQFRWEHRRAQVDATMAARNSELEETADRRGGRSA